MPMDIPEPLKKQAARVLRLIEHAAKMSSEANDKGTFPSGLRFILSQPEREQAFIIELVAVFNMIEGKFPGVGDNP